MSEENGNGEPITVRIRGRYLPHLISSGAMAALGFGYLQLDGPGYRKNMDDHFGRIQSAENRLQTLEKEIDRLRQQSSEITDLRVSMARLESKVDALLTAFRVLASERSPSRREDPSR